MIGSIIGSSICIITGAVCIIIGILNKKGNVSMLHDYHINNIKKEDIIPFGKIVGRGMIIVGLTLIIYGVLFIPYELTKDNIYIVIQNIVLTVGLIIGLAICLYAIKKYNKRIFG